MDKAIFNVLPAKVKPLIARKDTISEVELLAVFTMRFLQSKQNCIIPKLNSAWLIPIKVHPSFKKSRMRFFSFFIKVSLTVVTISQKSHQKL